MAKAKKRATPKRKPLSRMDRVEMMQTGRKPKKRPRKKK
jgi:hypothetical protein